MARSAQDDKPAEKPLVITEADRDAMTPEEKQDARKRGVTVISNPQ